MDEIQFEGPVHPSSNGIPTTRGKDVQSPKYFIKNKKNKYINHEISVSKFRNPPKQASNKKIEQICKEVTTITYTVRRIENQRCIGHEQQKLSSLEKHTFKLLTTNTFTYDWNASKTTRRNLHLSITIIRHEPKKNWGGSNIKCVSARAGKNSQVWRNKPSNYPSQTHSPKIEMRIKQLEETIISRSMSRYD